MKIIYFIVGLVLIFASFVFAADVNLKWDPVADAMGYRIYISLDNGITWDAGFDVGDTTTYIYPNVPEVGLVLFKIGAYNSAGESTSNWRGAWYDHTKLPIEYPSGLGID